MAGPPGPATVGDNLSSKGGATLKVGWLRRGSWIQMIQLCGATGSRPEGVGPALSRIDVFPIKSSIPSHGRETPPLDLDTSCLH